MRHAFIAFVCLAVAGEAFAQAPDVGNWIGRDEIPWSIPPQVNLPTVSFVSPLVPATLDAMGLEYIRVGSVLRIKSQRHLGGDTGTRAVTSSATLTLSARLGSIRLLSVGDQAAILKATLEAWRLFYSGVGETNGTENHFAILREKLLQRATSEGLSSELLKDCQTYREQLEAAQDSR